MNELSGKVALITGAGKGQGRILALALAEQGCTVAANDISPVNLEDLVQSGNGKIKAFTEDVAKKVGVQTLITQVEDDFGRIDTLINHAAVEPQAAVMDMDEWDWHRVMDVNLTGAFLMMQSVGRVMRARGGGVIINLINATPNQGQRNAAYLTSMAGLVALTRKAAEEFEPFGVHVHTVGKGLLEYQQADNAIPQNLVDAVIYLCNSELNGQVVNVDEGRRG